jgi:signal transduction histidine kinase
VTWSSIRVRIVAAFLAAITAMALALGFLMVQYDGVAASIELVTTGWFPLAQHADAMENAQGVVDTDVQRVLRAGRRPITGAGSVTQTASTRLREAITDARAIATEMRALAVDPEDVAAANQALARLEQIESLFEPWQADALAFEGRSESGHPDAAAALEKFTEENRKLAEEIGLLSRLVEGRIELLTDAAERKRARAKQVALGLAGVAVAISVVLVGAVLYALHPIRRLTSEVQRVAGGEYSRRLAFRGADEVAVFAREFDRMTEALQARDRRLVDRAEQLDRLSRYLGSVLDSLEDGLFVVEDGVVTLANPAAVSQWAVRPGEIPPDVVRPWLESPAIYEHRAGGAEFEVRSMSFGDAGVIVVTVDVTEQRRALDRLARSERLALVGQMLAQITHEVRNPLNALSLNAEMLSEEVGRLDPEHRSDSWPLLETVSGEIERLTAVTAHYLQLARRPKARLAPERLGDLVSDVVRLVHAELEQAGVRLDVTLEPLPMQLVDGNQLRQALLNVLRNAVEAHARHLRLDVSAAAGEVHIALTDDGPGMTADEIERAFDPFFSTKASGTGLGLAITRQILEDHDGTVRVLSEPGHGTTFVLVLPFRPSESASLSPSCG